MLAIHLDCESVRLPSPGQFRKQRATTRPLTVQAHRSDDQPSSSSSSSSSLDETTMAPAGKTNDTTAPPPRLPPTDAMMILMAPDGYYTYLNISKPAVLSGGTASAAASGTSVDVDQIKKTYRKLSVKHHPDKPSGDAETFRLLTRAKMVLSTPHLRKQYDVLGLDLDEDEDPAINSSTGGGGGGGGGEGSVDGESSGSQDDEAHKSANDGLIQEIASAALTVVFQVAFRTAILAFISVVVVRYRILLFPALAFLAYVAFRIHSALQGEILPPLLIGAGLIIMYQAMSGRTAGEGGTNWLLYWLGESIVTCMFINNSVTVDQFSQSLKVPILAAIAISGVLAALWFRGKFWNYVLVIGLEAFVAMFIAVVFPMFEMILEAVLNEKLKKIGEKVRAHHAHMERYYASKSSK